MRLTENMHKINVLAARLGLAGLFILSSCAADNSEDLKEPGETLPDASTVEVPVRIALGAGWSVDKDETRAAPPGVGGGGQTGSDDEQGTINDVSGLEDYKDVNEVRIEVFRRKVDSDKPFERDPLNCMVRPVERVGGDYSDNLDDGKDHKVATGKLTKVYGYEYKVIAVAYSTTAESYHNSFFGSEKGDLNRVSFSTSANFEDFKATMSYSDKKLDPNQRPWSTIFGFSGSSMYPYYNHILNDFALDIPQLFYGECYTESEGVKNTVIQFSEKKKDGEENSALGIQGILFRGMAKVEVRIAKPKQYNDGLVNRPPKWVGLFADNAYAEVGLRSYDDFLTDSPSMSTGSINTDGRKNGVYTMMGYTPIENYDPDKEVVVTAYMLPGTTKLAIRVGYSYGSSDLGVYLNGAFTGRNQDWADAGNGTGIISPDLHEGTFYLRRNHKYVIRINDLEKFMNTNRME